MIPADAEPKCDLCIIGAGASAQMGSRRDEHRVGDLLGGHQGRKVGVRAGHHWKQRRIDNAQTADAVYWISVTAIGSSSDPMRHVQLACLTPVAVVRI